MKVFGDFPRLKCPKETVGDLARLHARLERAVFGEKATAEVGGERSHGAATERHDVVRVVDEGIADGDVEEGALFGDEEDLGELVPGSRRSVKYKTSRTRISFEFKTF